MGREIADLAPCAAAEGAQSRVCASGGAAKRQIIQEVPSARRDGLAAVFPVVQPGASTVKLVHQHRGKFIAGLVQNPTFTRLQPRASGGWGRGGH